MSERELASQSFELIRRDFSLDESFDDQVDHPFEQLHLMLTRVIRHLLDHDFGGLMTALYRIDVQEQKVKEVLELSHPDELAANLAHEVISREKQKAETRIRYRET